jgi:hypothetical protein
MPSNVKIYQRVRWFEGLVQSKFTFIHVDFKGLAKIQMYSGLNVLSVLIRVRELEQTDSIGG